MSMKEEEELNANIVKGIVTARECECCEHHEMGITTDAGE